MYHSAAAKAFSTVSAVNAAAKMKMKLRRQRDTELRMHSRDALEDAHLVQAACKAYLARKAFAGLYRNTYNRGQTGQAQVRRRRSVRRESVAQEAKHVEDDDGSMLPISRRASVAAVESQAGGLGAEVESVQPVSLQGLPRRASTTERDLYDLMSRV
jgi:GH24 family phage-related lysozyme (muramidase)